MVKRGESKTLAEDVYTRLRSDILTGRLKPGERVLPATLRERFEVSLGVVREALTRLSEQRLVVSDVGRSFHVATLSDEELSDLTLVRCDLESRALALAIERGDLSWETSLVSAHHELSRTPNRDPGDPDRITDAWLSAHTQFHEALISSCGVPVLLAFCHELQLATELYRRWSGPASGKLAQKRDVLGEHQAILEAALARDAELACRLLVAHYRRTQEILLASGYASKSPPRKPARPGLPSAR